MFRLVNPNMRFPGDTRLFRNIKVREIPQWIAKRDFTPLGLWFSLKRCEYNYFSW